MAVRDPEPDRCGHLTHVVHVAGELTMSGEGHLRVIHGAIDTTGEREHGVGGCDHCEVAHLSDAQVTRAQCEEEADVPDIRQRPIELKSTVGQSSQALF